MHFDGEFRAKGHSEDVIARFTDVERMARCVPGASLEGRDEEGNYIGVIVVAFGPKRIKFRGKLLCEFDVPGRSGVLRGRGMADMRAARFEVRTTFKIRDDQTDPSEPSCIVSISSDVDLQGVLATFASGGVVVGNVLMQDFAANLAREYGEDGEATKDDVREVRAVAAHRVVWSAVKNKAAKLFSDNETKSNSPQNNDANHAAIATMQTIRKSVTGFTLSTIGFVNQAVIRPIKSGFESAIYLSRILKWRPRRSTRQR
jgi:uncharacterized protein